MIILSLGSNLSSKFGDRLDNLYLAMSFLEGYGILIDKKSTGIYNIGSGNKVLISDIIKLIFTSYNKKYFIKNTLKQTCLVANNSKIKRLNWLPTKNIEAIVKELL